MADYQYAQNRAVAGTGDMSVDVGLRKFMLGVYNKLGLGILLAGALAFVAGTVDPVTQIVFNSPFALVVQWAPLVLILGSSFLMRNPSPLATGILYWSIVTLLGLGLGIWVLLAESGVTGSTRGGIGMTVTYVTIAKAFFITGSAFGALSLWGYTTKRDLSGFGSFAVMALWGVVGMSVISLLFPPNSTIEWIIMAVVFVLSAVLVAANTQNLKSGYYAFAGDSRSLTVMTNWGALNFFIQFVNMFQIVMSVLSSRR